jgi:hypothetical protein
MTSMQTCLGAVALWAISLLGGMAAAQDADMQTQVSDVQQRYEDAIAARDYAALSSLFVENPIYLPISGGIIEDREGIASFYEQSGLTALDARSSRTETVGENLVLDIGTFTATLAEEAGGGTLEGEYVILGEVGENGLQIRSLAAFPARQAPGAQAQQ